MLLTENAAAAEILVEKAWAAREAASNRLDGVHVSDITGCSRKAWMRRNGAVSHYSTQDKTLFLVGEGHHVILQYVGADPSFGATGVEVPIRYLNTGVLIHGTIDLMLSEEAEFPSEIKTTRTSAAKPIESSSHYIEQIACYCVTTGVTRARLYALHLMGNYRDYRTPLMMAWDIEFTPEELTRWAAEMERRHNLIVAPEKPSRYEAYKWECGYCPFGPKGTEECEGGGLRVPFFINQTVPKGGISLRLES